MKFSKSAVEMKCPLCHAPTSGVLATKLRRGVGVVYYCDQCRHGFLVPKEALQKSS